MKSHQVPSKSPSTGGESNKRNATPTTEPADLASDSLMDSQSTKGNAAVLAGLEPDRQAAATKKASSGSKEAKEGSEPSAAENTYNNARADVRSFFTTWRDSLREKHADTVGLDTFNEKAHNAWITFRDDSANWWEGFKANPSAGKSGIDAVEQVRTAIEGFRSHLVSRTIRIAKELRNTWGDDSLRERWDDIVDGAHNGFIVERDQMYTELGTKGNTERQKTYRQDAEELWTKYRTGSFDARIAVRRWVGEHGEDFEPAEAQEYLVSQMGPLWAGLSQNLAALRKEYSDIEIDVPFYSQHMDGPDFTAGHSQCFYASKSMAEHTEGNDLKVLGPNDRIQVAEEENSEGYITTVDEKAAEDGIAYIDSELEQRRPVVVGVTCFNDSYNVDQITDHFVTINGRKGTGTTATYTYLDPWAENEDDARGEFHREGSKLVKDGEDRGSLLSQRYEVAMIRRNG